MSIRKPRSVQKKMTGIIFLVSMLVMFLTSLQFVIFELEHKRDTARDDIVSLADLISTNAQFPMTIKDHVAVKSILNSLSARKDVVSAYLLLPNGKSVAGYSRSQNSHTRIDSVKELNFLQIEARQIAEGVEQGAEQAWQEEDRLAYLTPISFEGSRVGYTYLSIELIDLRKHQLHLALGWLLAMGAAMLMTYLLSLRLQRYISGPVEQLASQMEQISREKRLVGFVPKGTDDEFNLLFHGFDEMIRALKPGGKILCLEPNNLLGYLTINTAARSIPIEYLASEYEFWITYQRGQTRKGLGYNARGEELPMLLSNHGIEEIDICLADKAFPHYPPYEPTEQPTESDEGLEQPDIGPHDLEDLRSCYLAGGGDERNFDKHIEALAHIEAAKKQSIINDEFSTGGGTLMYIVSGVKPGSTDNSDRDL